MITILETSALSHSRSGRNFDFMILLFMLDFGVDCLASSCAIKFLKVCVYTARIVVNIFYFVNRVQQSSLQ